MYVWTWVRTPAPPQTNLNIMEKKDWVKKLDYQMIINDKTEEKIWIRNTFKKSKNYGTK